MRPPAARVNRDGAAHEAAEPDRMTSGRSERFRPPARGGQSTLPQVIDRGDVTAFAPEPDLSQVVMRQTSWQYQRHIMEPGPPDDLDAVRPSEYLATLRRGWLVLLLLPLLAAGGAYWLLSDIAKVYTASAILMVNLPAASGTEFETSGVEFSNNVAAANAMAKTYSKLVASPPVLDRVIEALGLSETPTKLAGKVRAKVEFETQIITVSGDDRDPYQAAELTNTVAEQFVQWLAEQESARLSRGVQTLQESIDRAKREMDRTSAEIAAIRAQPGQRTPDDRDRISALDSQRQHYLNTFNALIELQQRGERLQLSAQSPVTMVSRAEPPLDVASRTLILSVAVAAILALGIAATGLVVLDRLDRRVRSVRDVLREVDLPVLASVSRGRRSWPVEIMAKPRSRTSEVFRTLRTKLRFATEGRRLGALAVTSTESDHGSSAVAANLAVALAQGGQRVVLIDANLRQPRQHQLFGLPSGPGLSDLLTGRATYTQRLAHGGGEVVRAVGGENAFESLLDCGSKIEGLLVEGPVRRLRLLRAGTSMETPADVISTELLEQITSVLEIVADVIIIDTPPLSGSAESLLVASAADHAVLVVEAGRTRPDSLTAASANIASTGVNVLGVVLHGVERGAVAA